MEYFAGAVLVLLGLLIVVFGSANASAGGGRSRARIPAWLDAVFKWTIGIACAWFGGQLLLGHAHYF
jgi:hypothetical protein